MVDWQSESDLDNIRNSCDVIWIIQLLVLIRPGVKKRRMPEPKLTFAATAKVKTSFIPPCLHLIFIILFFSIFPSNFSLYYINLFFFFHFILSFYFILTFAAKDKVETKFIPPCLPLTSESCSSPSYLWKPLPGAEIDKKAPCAAQWLCNCQLFSFTFQHNSHSSNSHSFNSHSSNSHYFNTNCHQLVTTLGITRRLADNTNNNETTSRHWATEFKRVRTGKLKVHHRTDILNIT